MSNSVLNYEAPRHLGAPRSGTIFLLVVSGLTFLMFAADGVAGLLSSHVWHLYGAGIPIDPGEITLLNTLWGLSTIGLFAAPAILFVTLVGWMCRAHTYLHKHFPRQLRFSRWDAAYVWFVPYWGFIRPFEIMKEIYAVSHGISYRTWVPACACWWGFLILGVLATLAKWLIFSQPHEEPVDDNMAYGIWTAVRDVPFMVSALCLMVTVYRIDRAQARLAKRAAGALS